jgi:hypothetical protein
MLSAIACDDDDGGDDPVPPTPTAATEAGITINQPVLGRTVTIPFAVSGTADVFEGSLQVRIIGPDGAAICERTVQAAGGAGTTGNWTATFAFDPALATGAAEEAPEITVRAWSISAEDGTEQDVVMLPVSLDLTPPDMVISEPRCNATFPAGGALAASGEAQVFEAALTVELQDANGEPVAAQNVLAASGTERSAWDAQLDLTTVPPGSYDLVAYSMSAEDGSVINEFRIPVTVSE